jgi:NADPH:quinone reductase-like Zn-dependent oxidoreductase
MMKAVAVNHDAVGHLDLQERPVPSQDSTHTLVSVRAFSLNRGEVRRAEAGAAGMPIGWDFSGTVEKAAPDGSGPAVGARVVGFSLRMEAFAELVSVPSHAVAQLPDSVDFVDAATLPVAGLTALYCLERCERLLGSKVLLTGASGGVGYFACQLATLMGAEAYGLVRRETHSALVASTGAVPIVSPDGSSAQEHAPFRSIVDGVGGSTLGTLLEMLSEDGRAVLYGVSDPSSCELPVRQLMFTGAGRVDGFHLYRESEIESAAKGLARLAKLVAEGKLDCHVSVREDWSKVGQIAADLIDRKFPGKAVLTL